MTIELTNRLGALEALREAAKRHGAKTELARLLNYDRRTIREKLRRDDGFTAQELTTAVQHLVCPIEAGIYLAPPKPSSAVTPVLHELHSWLERQSLASATRAERAQLLRYAEALATLLTANDSDQTGEVPGE